MDLKTQHSLAMDQADLAMFAKRKGDKEGFLLFSKKAFELESQAALSLLNHFENEPTRSVLFRSAASLAVDCEEMEAAEKLICSALMGRPPLEIAEELRDLLEQVHFKRHLALRGVRLNTNEIQMSIAGEGVGFGIAPTDVFMDKIEKTETLLYRTAERKKNRPFRDGGRRNKNLQDSVELFMTVPRAASFAVTFRVGNNDQLNLLGDTFEEEVIDELLGCLNLFVSGKEEELKKRIPEPDYYKNFVSLADAISPDGDGVNLVGFTSQRGDKLIEVAMKNENKISKPPKVRVFEEVREAISLEDPLEIIGILRYADSVSQKDKIQIIDEVKTKHTLIVPAGMMSDIVKPLWDSKVIATATLKGKTKTLITIKPYKD